MWQKRNHIICGLLLLAYFTWLVVQAHPHCSTYQYFFPFGDWIMSLAGMYYILSIHQLMGTLTVPTFWPLWMLLLWMFVYKFLCGWLFSVLLGINLVVKLLSYVATLCLSCWGTAKQFPNWLPHVMFPLAMYETSRFSTSLQILGIVSLITDICMFSLIGTANNHKDWTLFKSLTTGPLWPRPPHLQPSGTVTSTLSFTFCPLASSSAHYHVVSTFKNFSGSKANSNSSSLSSKTYWSHLTTWSHILKHSFAGFHTTTCGLPLPGCS